MANNFDDMDLTLAPAEKEYTVPLEVECATHKPFTVVKLELCPTHEEYESYNRTLKILERKKESK